MGLHGGRKTCQTTSRGREAPSNQFLKFEEFLKFPCFKKSNNFFFGLVQLLTFIQQAACTSNERVASTSNERVASTSNERVASAQKRGSARHLSSGEKGILVRRALDFRGFWGISGWIFWGFLDSILSTIWPGLACPLRYVRRGSTTSRRRWSKMIFRKVF